MKTLNQLIDNYTCHLRQGEIQAAYQGILDYMGKLRSDFISKYPDYEVGGNVYQGYMDMSYFSLNTKSLKDKGLKIAIVYLHEKKAIEAWLSARNREVLKRYTAVFDGRISGDIPLFHDDGNEDAAIEYTLTSSPDFDHQASLTEAIEQETEKFVSAITKLV
ncbi:hypothetical protein SDC9_197337 [bioreactor metagenome]|uniref:DUF7000 domain-containing protein n=1 Tax=bioreactor metagenome TaxID=1076179 RepID=A0A645IEL9_9ZZZZ